MCEVRRKNSNFEIFDLEVIDQTLHLNWPPFFGLRYQYSKLTCKEAKYVLNYLRLKIVPDTPSGACVQLPASADVKKQQ